MHAAETVGSGDGCPQTLGNRTARPLVGAAVVFLVVQGLGVLFPEAVAAWFCGGAARLSAWYWGASVLAAGDGTPLLALPSGAQVHVSLRCSGMDFFSLAAAFTVWSLARTVRLTPSRGACWLAVVMLVTPVVNACRIVFAQAAAQGGAAFLPPSVAGALHYMAGTAVFLPALLMLVIILHRIYEPTTDRQPCRPCPEAPGLL